MSRDDEFDTDVVTTAAALQPVTLSEAKTQLRIADDDTSHDVDLVRLIAASTEEVEKMANRALITQTITAKRHDRFPCGRYMTVPRGLLASVTSINYLDADGASQLWASSNYEVDTSEQPGRIWLAWGVSWPQTRGTQNAVTVVYTAGTSVANVPEVAKHVILLMVENLFENRGPVLVGSSAKPLELNYEYLLNGIRIGEYP